ncbi:MAG: hypothetical protein IPL14_12590 [Nitrospira sp.]|nr:hypothetical protein [Nitrospira sp.]
MLLDILEWIRATRVRHEIASHSFAQFITVILNAAPRRQADLTAAVEAAAKQDVTLKSFVFPRNQVGHLDVLREQGICAYRGTDPLPAFGKAKGFCTRP